jgi:TfoX/Sxy family transcriptional regulator of competence genes
MFGNIATFVHGHMFAGLLGDQIFVRLAELGRATLLRELGTAIF